MKHTRVIDSLQHFGKEETQDWTSEILKPLPYLAKSLGCYGISPPLIHPYYCRNLLQIEQKFICSYLKFLISSFSFSNSSLHCFNDTDSHKKKYVSTSHLINTLIILFKIKLYIFSSISTWTNRTTLPLVKSKTYNWSI